MQKLLLSRIWLRQWYWFWKELFLLFIGDKLLISLRLLSKVFPNLFLKHFKFLPKSYTLDDFLFSFRRVQNFICDRLNIFKHSFVVVKTDVLNFGLVFKNHLHMSLRILIASMRCGNVSPLVWSCFGFFNLNDGLS